MHIKSILRVCDSFFSKVELYLLTILLVFGTFVVFLLPVGGGYDEETHLMRVWEMSSFVFVPNDKLGNEILFPATYWEMSYRRPFLVRPVAADFWQKYGKLKIGALDFIYGDVETRSVYSPPLLLPQALVMRYLGRRLDLPALVVFYGVRWVGLLSYAVLVWLAVRLVPFGKWPLAMLAALPTAILQAATVSADAVSNGIAFLFIAIMLRASQRLIGWRVFGALIIAFILLFFGKLNLLPLAFLFFFLLRPSQFKMKHGYLGLIVAILILAAVEVAGWNLLAYGRLATAVGRANPVEQIKFILSYPFNFLNILGDDIRQHGVGYLRNSLAIYGYNYWPVSSLVYLLSGGAVLTTLGTPKTVQSTPWRISISLLFVFAVTYAATIASLYVTFTPVGSPFVDGVQGRYFLTVWPLFMLGVFALPGLSGRPSFVSWSVFLNAAALFLYVLGMYLVYYVPCGAQYFQPGLCYQPNYKNWSPQLALSAPVSAQVALRQEIVSECDGATEIRVWLDASQASSTALTNFALFSKGGQTPIFQTSVSNEVLPQGGWYSFSFAPEWNSLGQTFWLEISNSGNSLGPRLGYSLRPEYPEGKLYENQKPVEQDILFQIGCVAGWKKIRLRGLP